MFLIDLGHFGVGLIQLVDAGEKAFLGFLVTGVDELLQVVALPVEVFLGVFSGAQLEDFLQDFQVIRNIEKVARILVAIEIVKIVKPGPGDCGETHGARFMSGNKD
jgi:hypothetical protein